MMLKEKQTTRIKKTPDALESKFETVNPLSGIFTCMLISYLISTARVGGSGAPLCVSFIAVLDPFQGLSAFLGSMASFFVYGTLSDKITEISAMLGVLTIKYIVTGILKKSPSSAVISVIAGVIYFLCGIIASVLINFTLALGLAVIFRSVLCSIISYFVFELTAEYRKKGKLVISGDGSIATAVVYILLICSFCSIHIGYFNLGRTAGAFILLAVAAKYGSSGGASAGALASLGMTLSSYDLGKSAVLLTCTGLLAGMFAKFGKIAVAVVFIASNLIGSVITGLPSGSVSLFTDVIIASVLFTLIPERIYSKHIANVTLKSSSASKHFSDRLLFVTSSLHDVRNTVTKASQALDRRECADSISRTVCGKVCSNCRSNAYCGEDDNHRTEIYLMPAQLMLEKKGFLSDTDLPKILDGCPKKTELTSAFNAAYYSSRVAERFNQVSAGMRGVVFEQLSSFEDMLKEISKNTCAYPYCDDVMSESVKRILSGCGAKNPSVTVFFDDAGHIYIECFYKGVISEPLENVTEKIANITDRELDLPLMTSVNEITKLCIHEVPIFTAEIGHAGKNGREAVSGDSDNYFSDGFGKMFFIISDGMGSGGRAAVESRMTVTLLTRLLKAGVACGSAIRLINLLLLIKSSDEMFTTIDLLCLNLFTGKTDIIKLGAAQTFIKTGGTVKSVEGWSSPAGIIDTVDFEKRSAVLSDGDNIVMLSDGIGEDSFPRIRELMLSTGMSAQRMADEIIQYSDEKFTTNLDDKTIYVIKLHKLL